MTGADAERELINALEACGWTCMRAPASGGGTSRSMPDVLASKPDTRPLAIELKSTHSTNCYVTESEDMDLQEFCVGFGAEPVLGYKFKSRGRRRRIWLCHADDCRLTDGGHRALSRKNADSVAFLVVLPATGQQPAEVRKL